MFLPGYKLITVISSAISIDEGIRVAPIFTKLTFFVLMEFLPFVILIFVGLRIMYVDFKKQK
ncbi:hypothetical protein MALL_0527 [Mycoplasmopsis alligatoris A21JP2]|uniref:Uncharacterized protein n=1 Tax=Mycoplasmopsis alligatoris A21JP2 TaxID=747682 RepID=D4XVP6_9BACT|nr:hypothetical protein MALL_0527 [Mycoplasmopsis alligatoris A21JP2]